MDEVNDQSRNLPTGAARWKYLGLLLICIGIVYAQTLRFDFVTYDDYELVYRNGDFLSHLANVVTSFTTHAFTSHRAESGYYRPILLISYILDYQLWELNPFGYHLTNVLLHGATAVIVFLLLERLLRSRLASLLGSLLFALHPVQTESVAWVAGRNDLLLGFFIGLMLLCYLYYREEPGRRRSYWYCSIAAFGAALFTKESAAFYILLLPLYDLCTETTPTPLKKKAVDLFPYLAISSLYLFARWLVIGELIGAERLYGTLPLIDRLRQLPAILAENLNLVLSPSNLTIVHPVDQLLWSDVPWSMVAIIVPVLLVAALWYLWRRDRIGSFGVLWFLIGLIPLSGLFPLAVPILEHRLYVPLMGVALMVAGLSGMRAGTGTMHRMVVAGVSVLVCAGGVASFVRLPVWKNSATLWSDAIAKAPTVSRSYFNLAGYYFEQQQYDSTLRLLTTYVKLKPDDVMGYAKLRQTYLLAGKFAEAATVSRQIIAQNPGNPNRYLEAGMMFEQLQRYDSAVVLYEQGLDVDSNNFALQFRLGLVYRHLDSPELAERCLRRAVEISPKDPRGLFALGSLYASIGNDARAIEVLERGLKTGTTVRELLTLLSQLYDRTGQPEKARLLSEQYRF